MRVPSYRKHAASGQAVVTIAGRDRYLGKWDSAESRKEYGRLIAEFFSNPNSFLASPEQRTVSELILAYLNHCQTYYGVGEKTETHRIKVPLKAVRKLYGSTLAIDFGPIQFKAVRDFILEGKNHKDGFKPSRTYVNSIMRRIRRMFRWASGEGLLPPSIQLSLADVQPLRAGRTTARETDPVRPVSDDLVEATLPHLPPVIADMARLQMVIGCRPGELCAIKPSMVERAESVWEIHLGKHKTAHRGKQRTIYVGPKGQAILNPYLDRDPDMFCFRPRDSIRRRRTEHRKTPLNQGNAVGRSNTERKTSRTIGESYTTRSYGHAVMRACKKGGLEHWHPNQIRHSVATKVRKAYGIETASVILGHSEVGVTQIYAESDRARAVAATKEML